MARLVLAVLFVTSAACGAGGARLGSPEAPEAQPVLSLPAVTRSVTPEGTVTVAYPDVPAAWAGPRTNDVAAVDLAHLWGLPLFRLDEHGQLRPGVVASYEETTTDGGFRVDLHLADGAWTDGAPVTGHDVAATIEALQDAGAVVHPGLRSVSADGRSATLTFAEETADWPYLLLPHGGVLPRSTLERGGLEAFEDDVPVSGGPFRLEEWTPGRSATFVAHPNSPLGAPALQRLEVVFVPRYEAALGMLANGEVDVALGHLALNPVTRAEELDGVRAAGPLGGTSVMLRARPEARLGEMSVDDRRQLLRSLQVSELIEGLLAPYGAPATSVVAGQDGPHQETFAQLTNDTSVVLLVPRWHDVIGFTARSLERDLESHDVTTDVVTEETPFVTLSATSRYDAVLEIRRDPPLPALASVLTGDALRSQLSIDPGGGSLDAAVADAALLRPLYAAAPAHAWTDRVTGLRPSAWPGLGFWNVGEWAVAP